MNKNILTFALAGLIPLLSSNLAHSSPILESWETEFDFTPSNLGVVSSQTYTTVGMNVNGINLDITAYNVDNDNAGVVSSLTQLTTISQQQEQGVYVSGSNNIGVVDGESGDSHSMGGGSTTTLDEGLLFIFDQEVSLNYINFDKFSGSGDDFNLTVDGITKLVDFGAHDSTSLASQVSGQHDEYNFYNITGTEFLFWADGSSDSFRIDRLHVSAVPAPASILLLVSGLIGFGFARRKSR